MHHKINILTTRQQELLFSKWFSLFELWWKSTSDTPEINCQVKRDVSVKLGLYLERLTNVTASIPKRIVHEGGTFKANTRAE